MPNCGLMLQDRDVLMKYKIDYLGILHTWPKKVWIGHNQSKKQQNLALRYVAVTPILAQSFQESTRRRFKKSHYLLVSVGWGCTELVV